MPINQLQLPPPDPRYYRVNGADVSVQDGGTAASNAPDARRNLEVPGKYSDETIYGAWTFEGAVVLGSTISVEDASLSILDNADNTKVAKFQASGITTGTTRTYTLPNGTGTLPLLDLSAQIWAGTNYFTQLFIRDVNNFNAAIEQPNSYLTADRTLSLPWTAIDAAAGATFTFNAIAATLTNKTVALGSNTVSGTKAQFDTAVTDDNFAYLATAQTFTAKQTFQATGTGTVKVAVKGVVGQAANLQEWQLSTGAIKGYIDAGGAANFSSYNVDDGSGNTGSILVTDASLGPAAYIPSAAVVGAMALVGQGADPPASTHIGRVNRTAQAAVVAATNITNATSAGVYAIHYEMTCTTGDATAGTLTFDVIATGDGGAQTVSSAALPLTTATLSATNPVRGSVVRYLASGNITYSTTVTGAVNAARYALRARCEMLGP